MIEYPQILSFGGGVNSAALAIMAINDGWRGDIVFSDTGCEHPETYCWIEYFEREYLSRYGLSVTRLGPEQQHQNENPAKFGPMSLIDYCEQHGIIPMASVRWCTINWKVLPMDAYSGDRTQMLGIAADEAHRQRDKVRPLVDRHITRKGCIEIIEAAGLDVPQKSGCYICPFQRDSQWRTLWERHPELFERAARLEESVQRTKAGRTRATLDPSGKVTLRQRELSYTSQIELPDFDMDALLAYQPCICTL